MCAGLARDFSALCPERIVVCAVKRNDDKLRARAVSFCRSDWRANCKAGTKGGQCYGYGGASLLHVFSISCDCGEALMAVVFFDDCLYPCCGLIIEISNIRWGSPWLSL